MGLRPTLAGMKMGYGGAAPAQARSLFSLVPSSPWGSLTAGHTVVPRIVASSTQSRISLCEYAPRIDVWAGSSTRFVPQAILPAGSIEAAVAEARRAVGGGHKGVIMPAQPSQINPAAAHLYKPDWDPLWTTIQELDVPVCFRAGSAPSVMFDISPAYDAPGARAFDNVHQSAGSAALINGMVLSGILYRFPKLQPVFPGSEIDYVPFALEALDHQWERQRLAENEGLAQRPSEIFHRQC